MTTWYKVLNSNGSFLFGKGKLGDEHFPKLVEGEWQPGKWTPKFQVNRGTTGWHLTQNPYAKMVAFTNAVWIAEGRGASEGPYDDTAFESMRLLRPYQHPEWWHQVIRRVNEMNAFEPPFDNPREPEPKWHVSLAPTLHVAIGEAARAFSECACEPWERWSAFDIRSHMAYDAWTHATQAGLYPVVDLVNCSIHSTLKARDFADDRVDPFYLSKLAQTFWAALPVFNQSDLLTIRPSDSESDCLRIIGILEKGYLPIGRIADVWYVAGVR